MTVPVNQGLPSGANPALSQVLDLSNYLAKVTGLQEVLDNGLKRMMRQFDMEYGRIYLLNKSGKRLVLRSSQGIIVDGLESMSVNEGFSGKAIRSGSFIAQRISEVENRERGKLLEARGLKSVVCLPLIAMDKPLGVMNLAASRIVELDLATIDLMVVLGNLIAVSVLNARQARALEDKARELKAQKEAIQFFAYTASHDLKSPATAIHGLARMLSRQSDGNLDPKSKEICDQISKASLVIEELAGELNAYIKAKESPLDLKQVDLAQVLEAVRANIEEELARRGIQWRAPQEPGFAWADRLALSRALQNLVDNALNYGGPGLTRLEIGHQLTETHHVFSVRDDGVGLNPEQEEKVFSLFGRGETSKGTSGTGLGLAIVKEIAQRHGGDAWLESGQGKGCAFCFSLSRK